MVSRRRRRNPAAVRNPRMAYYASKLEEAEKVLEKLRQRSLAGVPIVVEGRRDETALRKLGIEGHVFCLKAAGLSRTNFLEGLDGWREVVVLTDFDREGVELRGWLYRELLLRGMKADDLAWRKIRRFARTEVRSVEELPSFLRATEARSQGLRT